MNLKFQIGRNFAVNRVQVVASCIITIFILSGCRETVVRDLSQRQALEVVGILAARGIEGSIVPEGAGLGSAFEVETERSQKRDAELALASAGLPSPDSLSSDDLLGTQGGLFPSSSFVERHRMDRALSAQIEEQVALFPGVSAVRVLLRLHGASEFAPAVTEKKRAGPTMTVVVKMKDDDDVRKEVVAIVRKVVPELLDEQFDFTFINGLHLAKEFS